ncbi:MAG: Crp/Fnr family transcriptional regulator [Idiomarina sp.]|nr:Crp/Fnr family transcriptional regulator [Idiomarina sp.]
MVNLYANYRNQFLAQLPGALRAQIQAQARLMTLRCGEEIALYGSASNYLYFPETAWLSLSQGMSDSSLTEILTVGREGILSIPEHNGSRRSLVAEVLVSGSAWRVSQAGLRKLAESHQQLQQQLYDYNDMINQQLFQMIACYRHHTVKQQLSRWLLAYDDKFPNKPFITTHAALANRLGVRREAVSTVASYLQSVGAIQYHRGQIESIDRSKLLPLSCECYSALCAIQKRSPAKKLGS